MPQITSLSPTVAAKPHARSRLRKALWFIMLVVSLGVVGYATRFFLGKPSDEHFAKYIVPLRLHIAGGMGALLAGPWQFSEGLRNRALEFHRWLGRFYLLSVTLGSIAGFVMATVSMEGIATHLGFGTLAVLWFTTAVQAYRYALKGEIDVHRRWMIRNFALTLAAVTLRNWLPLMLFALHWPFRASYITVSWVCWVPNLLVAEWMVRRNLTSVTPFRGVQERF
jgi:uncharacterized membrane protein